MATLTSIRSPFGQSVAILLSQTLAAWREARRLRRMYRGTLRELSALNEAELYDIGVHPQSIRDVAWEASYGKAGR